MRGTDTDRRIRCRDVGFGLLSLLAVGSVPVVQFAWLVVLDSTGLDTAVPSPLLWVALPALTVSLVVGLVGNRLYPPRRTAQYTVLVFLASAVVGVATSSVFFVGGPPPR